MNLNEINFSFGGLHCFRDFGMIYVEKNGHQIMPKIARNEYEIAGMSGTLLLDAEDNRDSMLDTLTLDGSLYFWDTPPSQAVAQERLRRVAAWLCSGRKRLIMDYEPHRYYMAQADDGAKWSYSGWMDGGLDIKLTAQPCAYAVRESMARAEATGGAVALVLTTDTGRPAPLCLSVECTGTAPITGVAVTLGTRQAALNGISLPKGQGVNINMEPPIGAAFFDGTNALPYAGRFDWLTAAPGRNEITVGLTYGAGTKGARVTAKARGRWL